jgi:WD40 repeat protein
MYRTHLIVLCFSAFLIGSFGFSQSIFLEPQQSASFPSAPFHVLQFAADGNKIACAGNDNSIHIIDPLTLNEQSVVVTKHQQVTSARFKSDGNTLLLGGSDGWLTEWKLPEGISQQTIFAHTSKILDLDVSSSGKIITISSDRTIKYWQIGSKSALGSSPANNTEPTAVALHPTGIQAAVGLSNGLLQIFSTDNFMPVKSIPLPEKRILSLQYSRDGKLLAVSCSDSSLYIFSVGMYRVLQSLKSPTGSVASVSFSNSNDWLVTAGRSIEVWNVQTGKLENTLSGKEFTYVLASCSPASPTVFAATSNGALTSFSLLTEKPDNTPPVIELVEPRSEPNGVLKLYADRITVSGTASDESTIQRITVAGNETKFTDVRTDSGISKKQFSVSVPLTRVGINEIIISATDKRNNTATQVLNVQRLTKNTAVEILSPKDLPETDELSLRLEFKPYFEYVKYTISLNTIELISKHKNPNWVVGNALSETISLSAGLNQIELTILKDDGEKITNIISLNRRTLTAPVSTNADIVPRNTNQPQRWAVIVGISEYQNPQIKNLNYADRDAKDFAQFLQSSAGGGFEPNRMKILLNKEATLSNVKQALFNFLRQTIDKDLVIIYFAGHGAPELANPNNNYLLTYDTDPQSLETTAFPMWDINTALQRYIPSKRVVIFTDACHSGGISSDLATRGVSLSENNLINQYLSDLSKSKEGTIVFTASQAGEVSQELDKYGHGVFTYFLLQGMKGDADFNNDFTVTIGELMDFVEEKVKRQTNGNQHPTRNQGTYDTGLTISLIPH